MTDSDVSSIHENQIYNKIQQVASGCKHNIVLSTCKLAVAYLHRHDSYFIFVVFTAWISW